MFERWKTLYEVEPWGEERLDFAVGTLCMVLQASQGIEPRGPSDYMHYLRQCKPPEKPQTDDQIEKTWDALAAIMEHQASTPAPPPKPGSLRPKNKALIPNP